MSDYTPMTDQALSTDEVRSGFIESWIGDGSVTDQDDDRIWGAAEVDRWLTAHDAQVKAEALQGAEWDKRRLLHRLALLADGFHFAGRLSAEKALRAFIETGEAS